MKTSNKILAVYGVLFAAFTFGSLGLNVQKYRAGKPAMQTCLEALRDGRGKPVLVVDPDVRVGLNLSDHRNYMLFNRDAGIASARVSGDTLFVSGGRYLSTPNSVKRIIRGEETIEVPPVEEWGPGEKFF
jgi:hypothetical protein